MSNPRNPQNPWTNPSQKIFKPKKFVFSEVRILSTPMLKRVLKRHKIDTNRVGSYVMMIYIHPRASCDFNEETSTFRVTTAYLRGLLVGSHEYFTFQDTKGNEHVVRVTDEPDQPAQVSVPKNRIQARLSSSSEEEEEDEEIYYS